MMKYKGYTGKITSVDKEQGIFHGEIAGINDVVTFEGRNLKGLLKAFRDSVDDYLEFCEEENEKPEKPYSGKFLLRMPPDLHREATLAAKRGNVSLNAWVEAAVEKQVRGDHR